MFSFMKISLYHIFEDNEVPTEIELMADKRSVPLYLKLLESGSEKKRDIRLVIVGKKGAGKTSLVNRLFKEGKKDGGLTSFFKRLFGRNNADVTSTNGIEIHVIKCKAQYGDSIWNKLEESNTFFDISNEIHPMSNIDEKKYTTQILCSATGKNDWRLMTITYTTVGTMQSFGIKFIKFSCQTLLQNEHDINPSETGQPINALDILMKSHRCFAKRKCPARNSNYKETELNARLLKPYEEELANKHSLASIEKAAHNTFNDNTSPTGFDESKVPLSSSQSTKLKHPGDTECKEETQEDSQIERLVATAYTEKNSEDTQVKHSDGAQETFKDNTLILYRRVDESNDSTFFSQQNEKIKPSVVTQVEPPVTTKSKITNTDHQQKENLLLAKTHKNIKAMMDKSKVDLHDKEEYVNF
ncbi:unnamed protein product [Mytilus edulis]|uniref:Uncharacterized protein n=1 Tax=Mytilus edulis TaxID=6550 RepID=A0A8S3S151_MYTED|nr:unnamed protein product [Mytilus edulis]